MQCGEIWLQEKLEVPETRTQRQDRREQGMRGQWLQGTTGAPFCTPAADPRCDRQKPPQHDFHHYYCLSGGSSLQGLAG